MQILILGVGNLLWADEGFGVRCAETLVQRYRWPETVTILDGGTQGIYLLPYLQAASHLLILDAADFGKPPGTLLVARDNALPAYWNREQLSLHQMGMNDLLACAQLTGQVPQHITLIGVQPVVLDDFGGSLSDPIRQQIEPALTLALAELSNWKVNPLVSEGSRSLVAAGLTMARYETERPSSAMACRYGDARFLGDKPDHGSQRDRESQL